MTDTITLPYILAVPAATATYPFASKNDTSPVMLEAMREALQ